MMQAYAMAAGLPRRLVVKVPVLTPGLSSHWVNLVTPVPFGLARPLVGSLTNEVVVRSGEGREDVTEALPGEQTSYRRALELALMRLGDADVETSWRDAELAGRSPADPYPGDPDWTGGTLFSDVRETTARCAPEHVFAAVSRIGGTRGWPTHMWAWRLRGFMDRLIGGVGLRRGRRDPERLRVGDALDFWRVEEARSGELIRLRAEMRLPGRAWLEWRLEPVPDATRVVQRALFAPRGLSGRVYWWSLLPFHGPLFTSTVVALARDAEELAAQERTATDPPPAGAVTNSDAPTGPPEGLVGRDGTPDDGPPPARRAG
ncbi:hypothetical protein BH23ACT8_BH23ACT8_19110 [soil metagenome]